MPKQVNAARMSAGWRKVTLFLNPDALAGLDALARVHGSKDAGARALLAYYAGRGELVNDGELR